MLEQFSGGTFVRLEIFRQANGLGYFFQLSIEIVLIPA